MFKTAATKLAHNSTIPALAGNRDLRPLQDLITAEKAVLISLQKLSVDFGKASEALRIWGVGEGDDLGDTLAASTTILNYFANALTQYASRGHAMRDHLKAIRSKEESLDELKRRRKAVGAKADSADRKLSKMSPEHKNFSMQTDLLNRLRDEIRSLDSEIMTEEAALGDYKRHTTRTWMGIKFGGLLECCEKGTIIGEYGKLVVAEIPEETTQPGMARSMYYGHSTTESLVAETHRCVNEITLSTVLPSETRQSNQPTSIPAYAPGGPPGGEFPPGGPRDWSNDRVPVGGPSNFLSTPQGIGMGHFLDARETPSMTGPGSPQHHYPSSMPPYPQMESPHPAPSRSVDDFGFNPTGSSGPIDPSAASGRFATFPVKTRASGGSPPYTLYDNPPPALHNDHEPDQSFSSSIAEALSSTGPQESPHEPYSPLQNSAPSYEVSHGPTYDPPPGPPPGAASGAAPWADSNRDRLQVQDDRQHSHISDDDAQLAYMASHEEHQEPRGYGQNANLDTGHAGFGGDVGDVSEDPGRRGSQQSQNKAPYSSSQTMDRDREPSDEITSADHDQRFQSQHRIPPPSIDSEEDERALNAAAAREISRELDALNFNPSPLTVDSPYPGGPPREPSPLAPPQAPFARRSVSPHPIIDTGTLPYPGSSQQSPIQGRPPSYDQPPPDSELRSPTSPLSPRLHSPLPSPPALNLPQDKSQSFSPSNDSYRTPPEYPRSLNASPMTKSMTSLNSPIPVGARTISASAFKRPPQRKMSGNDAGVADTSPLSLKKRLPSSPHPERQETMPSALSRDPSGHLPIGDRGDPRRSSPLPPPPGADADDDHYDYISAYVNNDSGGTNVPNPNDPAQRSHGYGEGKFATDLDGNSLR